MLSYVLGMRERVLIQFSLLSSSLVHSSHRSVGINSDAVLLFFSDLRRADRIIVSDQKEFLIEMVLSPNDEIRFSNALNYCDTCDLNRSALPSCLSGNSRGGVCHGPECSSFNVSCCSSSSIILEMPSLAEY